MLFEGNGEERVVTSRVRCKNKRASGWIEKEIGINLGVVDAVSGLLVSAVVD